MPAFDGKDPVRNYHGWQFVLNKRYSNRWQALASFVYSKSSGMSRRSFRQDFNVEGPMFYDDNWMGNLNYTINNLEGPLPFTPKYEFKVSGSYKIPALEVDLCGHATLARAHAVWTEEILAPNEIARFHTRSGLLTATRYGDWIELDFPATPAVPAEAPDGLLASLGLSSAVRSSSLITTGASGACPERTRTRSASISAEDW